MVNMPSIKPKFKINITYAPGALEQNALYVYNQKRRAEMQNWYPWDETMVQESFKETSEEDKCD